MKSLKEFLINETKFETEVCKSKTFGDVFCLYFGIDRDATLEEDDFDMNDAAFLFNRDDMSYEEFMKWFDEVKDEPITRPVVKNGVLTFSIRNTKEKFELDYVGDDLD